MGPGDRSVSERPDPLESGGAGEAFPFRLLWPWLLAGIATVALVFAAPALETRPLIVAAWLLAAHIIWLVSLRRGGTVRLSQSTGEELAASTAGSGRSRSFLHGLPLLLPAALVLAAFVFAPVYFSDDSIRHIHDGFYLLQGVDVYSTPPEKLPPLLDRLPNHPDVGTIYLPFTQLQAMLGAAAHPQYGFLALYYILCFAALVGLYCFLESDGERGAFLLFCFSPAFLIPLASRHADVQGLLFVCLALGLLRIPSRGDVRHRGGEAGSEMRPVILRAGVAGLALSAAAGLKPEGLIWAGAVTLYLIAWLIFARGSSRALVIFVLAGALGALGQLLFARLVLFPGEAAWGSFLDTVTLFTRWFAAYNPILDLREFLYPDLERPVLLAAYRREVVALATLWMFLPFFRLATDPIERLAPGEWAGYVRVFLGRLLVAALSVSILSKGVWHPWYFLWLLPALWMNGRRTSAAFLAGALPLFYLPVVYLRASGEWWMPVFYGSTLVYTALFFGARFFFRNASGGARSAG